MQNIKEGTELSKLESWMNDVFSTLDRSTVQLTTFVNDKLIKKLKKTQLSEFDRAARSMELGCIRIKGIYDSNFEGVTVEKFLQWHQNIPEFQARWTTLNDFLNEIKSYESALQKLSEEAAVKTSQRNSDLTDVMSASISTYKWFIYGTNTSALICNITEPDREFILNHLFIAPDSSGDASNGQFYWKFKSGEFTRIPVDKGGIDANDTHFWKQWWRDNSESVKYYVDAALQHLTSTYIQTQALGNNEERLTFSNEQENALHGICPLCLLRCLTFGQKYIRTKEGNVVPTNVFVTALRKAETAGSKLTSMTQADWTPVLSRTILSSVNEEKVKVLKHFSNTPSEAIHFLGTLPIANKCESEPALDKCPTWKMFLNGKFPSERMGKFRLAAFIKSVLDADDYSRQYLYCCGEGQDGKSVLVNAIAMMFGVNAASGVKSGCFTSNFGLQSYIGKRLLVVDDAPKSGIYNFLRSEELKRFTGGSAGSIFVDVKCKEPIEWVLAGAKLAIASNSEVSLWEEADITRMNLLTFQKNYKRFEEIDSKTLIDKLASEKVPFFQWCIDYVQFYSNMKSKSGKRNYLETQNGITIVSDQMFDEWYNDDPNNIWNPELTSEEYRSLRKRAFEEESTLPNRFLPFVKISQEGVEDVEDVMGDILDLFVEPADEDYFLQVKDLSNLVGFIGRNINKLSDVLSGKQVQQLTDSGILKYEDHFKRVRSAEWRAFSDTIEGKFKVNKCYKKIEGTNLKGFNGIRLRRYEGFESDSNHITKKEVKNEVF